MKNQSYTWIVIAVVILIGGFYLSQESGNPSTPTSTNEDVRIETIQVTTFYNGENGYSLSIPSGNNSTCIWNWTGGNAAIPFSETTYANTATEKHALTFGKAPNGEAVSISGVGYDFKVTCLDDFGNQYKGVFPVIN